jgi:sulfate/thiosulfate transport system ATP-binding protein
VALARALAVDPKVLLLDEPFGALDANVRRDLRRWLREIHDELGITTIFVTHDQEEALDLADRVVILDKGRIVQEGTPQEVCRSPGSAFVMRFLGDANRFDADVKQGEAELGGLRLPAPGVPDGKAQSSSARQISTGRKTAMACRRASCASSTGPRADGSWRSPSGTRRSNSTSMSTPGRHANQRGILRIRRASVYAAG